MTRLKNAALAAFALVCLQASAGPLPYIESHVIRGVYWPWERTKLHADHAGLEFWAFVDREMARIHDDWHCNVVWFVNGPSEPGRVCDLAAKHGLKVLSGTRLGTIFVYGLRTESQLAEAVTKTVTELADKPALGAYVLKDEAKCIETAQMETYRQALEAADPSHPSIVVTMTGHTEPYALDTGFPIICTDIYHFGGNRSPAIPNPAPRSRQTFRSCVESLNAMTESSRKIAWSMPQAFTEVWGASWLDDQGHVVIEPGSYWHWRMPTVGETRWQIWESIRAGCKGVVFFSTLLGGSGDWTPAKGPMPDKMVQAIARNKGKWPLVAKQIDTGEPACLTGNGGTTTPQADAMAEAYGTLARFDDLIVRWYPDPMPAVYGVSNGACRTFRDPAQPTERFAVVVNDQTDAPGPRPVRFHVPPNAAKVTDLATGTELPLTPEAVGNEGLLAGTLELPPGGGTILRIQYRDARPGILLYDESFERAVVTAGLNGVSRHQERRPFGMGTSWRVRKDKDSEAEAFISLENLHKHNHGRGSALATAMGAAEKGTARVFLKIDGSCPKPEDIVIQFVDKDGKAGWNKTDAYDLPISLPPGTEAIRIRLSDSGAVDRLRLWRVELPSK